MQLSLINQTAACTVINQKQTQPGVPPSSPASPRAQAERRPCDARG
jgi:hypothetical protein